MFLKRGISLFVVIIVAFVINPQKCIAQDNVPTPLPGSSDWISCGNAIASIDSSFQLSGIVPLKMSSYSMFNRILPLDIDIHYVLKLPDRENGSSVSVSLRIRSENIYNGKIYFRHINEQEEVIQIDSCFIPISKDSLSINYEVHNCDTRVLLIQVRSDGKSNSIALSPQRLWITDPLLDGENPNKLEHQVDMSLLLGLNQTDSIDFTRIDQLKSIPIVAFGELIHGSENINKLVFSLIKYRIEFCNTKLVILEFNAENMLLINRYIQGDSDFVKTSIQKMFDRSLLSNHVLELIDWVKVYNQRCDLENRVWIWGTEIASNTTLSNLYCHDFFKVFRDKYSTNKPLRFFCRLLLSSDESKRKELIRIFDQTNGFQEILSKEESLFLQLYFKKLELIREDGINLAFRDKQMYDLCDYFISRIAPRLGPDYTVTIFTHFWHANYLNGAIPISDYQSMGYWMKRKYGQDYKCFGITSSGGSVLSKNNFEDCFVENEIVCDPESIESSLSHVGKDIFINSNIDVMNKLNATTLIGTFYRKNNIQYMNLSKRADGLFYLKKSASIFKPQEVRDENRNFTEWLFDWYKKELDEYRR